jgi:uncharacterized protein YhfF
MPQAGSTPHSGKRVGLISENIRIAWDSGLVKPAEVRAQVIPTLWLETLTMRYGVAGYRLYSGDRMNVPSCVRPFWREFQAALGIDASDRFYEAFHFDDNAADANALVKLVLNGTKGATAGLLWSCEATDKQLPSPGVFSVVISWDGEPLCVIETTDVDIMPFDQVTEHFAAAEGEGDKTLRHGREVHWAYFSRECERLGKEPDLRMPVIYQQFSVAYAADV